MGFGECLRQFWRFSDRVRWQSLEGVSGAKVVRCDDVEMVRVGGDLTGQRSIVQSTFDRCNCRAEFVISWNVHQGYVEGPLDRLDETLKKPAGMGAFGWIKIPVDVGVALLAAVEAGRGPEAAQFRVAADELRPVVGDHDRGLWISGEEAFEGEEEVIRGSEIAQ